MSIWLIRLVRSVLLLAPIVLAACQAPTPLGTSVVAPAPVNGIGYMVFSAPITSRSRDLFVENATKLIDAGANTIQLAINSPGGDIDAAQGMVDYMASVRTQRSVKFEVYNIGLVASAASYVYLNAERRYSGARGVFLFHAAGVVSTGLVPAERLRDQVAKLEAYERTMRNTLKTRTRLTDGEALTYVRRTVLLNSDDARRDGIVDSIAEFQVPLGARTWTISTRNPAQPPRPAAPSPTPN